MTTAILTDIEGTVGSIAFVRDVLFPYARHALPDYIQRHHHQPDVAAVLAEAADHAGLDPADTDAVIAQLLRWIDEDRKVTPLKTLQGWIWEAGYRDGAYRAHIYPDALERLQQWHRRGRALYVYSSGSIAAQRLYFAHTEAGDITGLFSGYFDTTSGPKSEAQSYRRIADAIGRAPADMLFLSDTPAELDAARATGFATTRLLRPHDHPDGNGACDHPIARDFHAVD